MKDIGVSPEKIKIQYERQKCKEANQMTKPKWEELGEGDDQYQRTLQSAERLVHGQSWKYQWCP